MTRERFDQLRELYKDPGYFIINECLDEITRLRAELEAPTVGAQHAVPALDNAEQIAKLREHATFLHATTGIVECRETRAADTIEAQAQQLAELRHANGELALQNAKLLTDVDQLLSDREQQAQRITDLEADLAAATARADFVSDCIITGADASTGQLFIESISRKDIVSGVTLGMHLLEWIATLEAAKGGK